jgi:acyl-CoA reductase-like NAD-dependent aldehyde dehydrogenase
VNVRYEPGFRLVFDDADLGTALNGSLPSKYANAGQVCVTPDRFFELRAG